MTTNSAGKGRRKPWTEKQKAFLVGHIERKKRKAERKADRESRERLDAWMLQYRFPEKAKAKRLKGTKNNKEASRQRSQMFVERFEAWPSVLSAEEIGLKIRAYLREQATWKWKGCAKHYPKKEASVRKKLTKLGVYRFNFPLGLWFKCGSPEEALEEQRLAEIKEKSRLNEPAPEGWTDKIMPFNSHMRPKAERIILQWCRVETLAEVKIGYVEHFLRLVRQPSWEGYRLENLLSTLEREMLEELAEAVLVAD